MNMKYEYEIEINRDICIIDKRSAIATCKYSM